MTILAIAHDFDPMASPQAIQIGRHLAHLQSIAIQLVSAGSVDSIELLRNVPTLKAHLRIPDKAVMSPIMHRIGRLTLPVFAKTPDDLGRWKQAVLAAVPGWIKQQDSQPDVIVTFGEPMTDHLIGLALKNDMKLPWIAHFSDPWSDNPFRRGGLLTRWLNRRQEARVLAAADMVIFTSEETAELVGRCYDEKIRRKFRILGHAYERSLFPDRQPLSGKVKISHIGSFYGNRSPDSLLAGLGILAKRSPQVLQDVEIELVGSMPRRMLQSIADSVLPEGLVKVTGPVSYTQSLARMVQSDLLLLIDAPAQKSVFLASKLIDYIGAGRQIMAITPPGTAARVVNELGGIVVDPGSTDELARILGVVIPDLHAARSNPSQDPWGNASVRQAYDASRIAARLQQLIEEVKWSMSA
jgi:glycosyltransferase involved in cell wall biosynthesis